MTTGSQIQFLTSLKILGDFFLGFISSSHASVSPPVRKKVNSQRLILCYSG